MPLTFPSGKSRGTVRVLLLVDDDADLLDALAELVEQRLPDVRVVRAKSGREGLGILQEKHVDGIVADFGMQDMDGLEFLCIARRCHPAIPRAMLTAHEDPDLGRLAKREAAVESFLTKLVDPDELLAKVNALLAGPSAYRAA